MCNFQMGNSIRGLHFCRSTVGPEWDLFGMRSVGAGGKKLKWEWEKDMTHRSPAKNKYMYKMT